MSCPPLRSVAVIMACVAGVTTAARADTLVLSPNADNTLIENATGALSNGGGDAIYVGIIPRQGNGGRRGLLRFDLSGIPVGATITAATLTLTLVRSQSETSQVSVHRATESWGEGASVCDAPCGQGAPAAPGDATWLHRFYPAQLWSAPGGGYVAAASATATVTPNVGTAFAWNSAQLLADVQQWVANPAGNFGWVMVDAASASSKAYASREHALAAQRPTLTLTFALAPSAATVPLPSWASIALAATLALTGAAVSGARAGGRQRARRRQD